MLCTKTAPDSKSCKSNMQASAHLWPRGQTHSPPCHHLLYVQTRQPRHLLLRAAAASLRLLADCAHFAPAAGQTLRAQAPVKLRRS